MTCYVYVLMGIQVYIMQCLCKYYCAFPGWENKIFGITHISRLDNSNQKLLTATPHTHEHDALILQSLAQSIRKMLKVQPHYTRILLM